MLPKFLLCFSLLAAPAAFAADVIEFYNSSLDTYFITASAAEAASIDTGGSGPGWTRTGYRFTAGGSTAVCRFYGSVSPGPNSHLYVMQGSECTGLQQLQASTPATQPRWNFESLDFLSTPVNSGGICPSGTVPVYRAYNNGATRHVDSNHRLSTDLAAIKQVEARGWVYEGVAMCAPPAAASGTCKAGVSSGFSGDLNAIYTDRGGGGGGNGEGGGGGAGAGGGEGKILGALVTVTRISDGVVLGSAVTDNFNGLITIKPCTADGPLLLTMSGQAGAVYYDEAIGQLTPFGTGQVLHALVDYLDENVGVSALTEAAFRYALNTYFGTSTADAAVGATVRSTGSVTGLTLAQVQASNQAVLTAFNGTMGSGTQLVTVKSLPTPIDKNSAGNALPVNRYGIAATALGGFVKAAGSYQPSSATPALGSTEQLARDLTDGKLDGTAKDGTAAATGTGVFYAASSLPSALFSGMTAVASQFGKGTTSTVITPVSPYAGSWSGPMKGDVNADPGAVFDVNASGNFVNVPGGASQTSNGVTATFNGTTGTVSASGAITYSSSVSTSGAAGTSTITYSFSGSLTQQGTGSGTYIATSTDSTQTFRGTWQATKK